MAKKSKKFRYANTTKRVLDAQSGGKGKTFKLPEGWSHFAFENSDKAKKYLMSILPTIAGPHNKEADEGEPHWRHQYAIHKKIGPEEKTVPCNAVNFGEPCFVCEHRNKLIKKGADKDTVKAYYPSTRDLFAVKVKGEEGYQLFETYGFMKDDKAFGQMLLTKMEDKADKPDHSVHRWWWPHKGKDLSVLVKKSTFPGGSFAAPTNIEFVKREEQFAEELPGELPCLEDCIIKADYEEVKKMFLGVGKTKPEDDEEEEDEDLDDEDTDDEEDEEEEKPKKKSKKKKEEDDDDSEETDEEDDEEESDDDDSGDDEEDEGDADEEEDDGDEIKKGSKVKFKYKDKKKKKEVKTTGTVVKIDKKKELYSIEADDRDEPHILSFDDPSIELLPEDDEEEDDTDDEDDSPLDGEEEEDEGSEDEEEEDDGEEEDEEEEDDEDDEDDEKPKKKVKKEKGKKGKKKKEEDEDEEEVDDETGDEDDDDEWEEDEDDD
jgi:hypothetical protein